MRLDGTEIGNPYTEFVIDPTAVKAGDGIGSEVGSAYDNKISKIDENITQNPIHKYDVLAGAMRDPELSETDRYRALMSFCSPTEAGNNYKKIFGEEQAVSIGPKYSFHDPMGQIEKIPLEKMVAVEAAFENGAAAVLDEKRGVLYSNKSEVLSRSINEALRTIIDYSKTNPEGAWYLANEKKVGLYGYEVPMGNFLLNYRELTGEREETVRQYTERMGVEKVLDKHKDDIRGEMKNYGLKDRIFYRKELRERIAEKKYAREAGNPIRTHEDVEELVERLNENGYGDIVDALDFEALRQGKGKGKEIGELFGIEPVGDDDAGVYKDSESPESLEFTQKTDENGKIHLIPNMQLRKDHEKYLKNQGYVIDYKDAEKTVKKGKSGILKKIAALGATGLVVVGGVGLVIHYMNGSDLGENIAWRLSESTGYKPYTADDVISRLDDQLKSTKKGYDLPVITKNRILSEFAEERADYEVSFKKYSLDEYGNPAYVAKSLDFPKELVESGQFDPNNPIQLSDNTMKMMEDEISMSYEIYTIESGGKKNTLAAGLDVQDILPDNISKNSDVAQNWSGDTQLQYAIYSDPRIDEFVTVKGAGCGWANIYYPEKMPHAEDMANAIMGKWMSGEGRDIILDGQEGEYGLGGAQYEGNGGMVFVLEVYRKG